MNIRPTPLKKGNEAVKHNLFLIKCRNRFAELQKEQSALSKDKAASPEEKEFVGNTIAALSDLIELES